MKIICVVKKVSNKTCTHKLQFGFLWGIESYKATHKVTYIQCVGWQQISKNSAATRVNYMS